MLNVNYSFKIYLIFNLFKMITKTSKILFSYLICFLILFIGWFFSIRYNRNNTLSESSLSKIQNILETKLNYVIHFQIEDSQKKEHIKNMILNIFNSPKSSQYNNSF